MRRCALDPRRRSRSGWRGLAAMAALLFTAATALAQGQPAGGERPRGVIRSETPKPQPEAPDDPTPSYRRPDPTQVVAPPGYVVEVYATALDFPVDITFSDKGELFIAESGYNGFGTDPDRSPGPQIIQVLADGTKKVIYDNAVPYEEIRKANSSADMPEGLIPPITGITWHDGKIYVAHRSRYSVFDPKAGTFKTIVNGLPSWGEFVNGKAIFDRQGRMVFHVAAQGNLGVIDQHWAALIIAFGKLGAHEVPGEDVALAGKNFVVPLERANTMGVHERNPNQRDVQEENSKKVPYSHRVRLEPPREDAPTGAFVPLWTETRAGQTIRGEKICNAAFFRCGADGKDLERIAWGIRSSFGYRYAPDGRLICTQNGANPTPPRGAWFDQEALYEVVDGEWYGWPDFLGGLPITEGRFRAKGESPEFILNEETHRRLLKGKDRPRQPLLRLPPHSAPQGFVFGRQEFGVDPDDILVAEFGTIVPLLQGERLFYPPEKREEHEKILADRPRDVPEGVDFDWPGFKVQVVDPRTGQVWDFLTNAERGPTTAWRGGGLERPVQLEWGPDGALYVVDMGVISSVSGRMNGHIGTGVVWRVIREGGPARPLRSPGAAGRLR